VRAQEQANLSALALPCVGVAGCACDALGIGRAAR
jgi:hypothetical protein